VTLGLYLRLGSPDIPDAPHAAPARPAGDIDLEKARGQLEARLAKEPDSIEGWYYLGQADMGLGRWKDSRDAFGRALSLSNRRPDVLEAYGTMLMNEADGSVTPEAQSVFEETVSKKPDAVRARYDLALAKAQQGDIAGARALWQAMARDAPADAPWLPSVKQSIEVADRQLAGDRMPEAPAGKPPAEVAQIMTLPPSERIDAIRGMVAGLAAKLAASPDDPAGWQRLGRSYMVLNQPKDAAEAYARAAALAPGDAAAALGRAEALLAIDGDAAPLSRDTVDAFRKVLALDADQPEGLYYLGLAASQRGDTDEARQLWQRLLGRLDPAGSDAAEVGKRLAALPPAK
jgi:cytochrome c-type biogenesis protein CcmH